MDSKSIYKNAYSIHYKEKNFDKALPLYQKIIEDFPNSAEAGYAKSQIDNVKNEIQITKIPDELNLEHNAEPNDKFFKTNVKQQTIKNNEISAWIRYVGYIAIVSGIIMGLIMGMAFAQQSYVFQWSIAFTWWVIGIVGGLLFIGFSEVIRLLHEINEKLNKSE